MTFSFAAFSKNDNIERLSDQMSELIGIVKKLSKDVEDLKKTNSQLRCQSRLPRMVEVMITNLQQHDGHLMSKVDRLITLMTPVQAGKLPDWPLKSVEDLKKLIKKMTKVEYKMELVRDWYLQTHHYIIINPLHYP